MTWGRQVLHVVKKDLREHWVWLVALVVAIAAAVVRMQAWTGDRSSAPSSDLQDFATMLLLATTAVVIVQSDVPGSGKAFWATLPLRTSAVAVAKMMMTVLLLAIVVGGAVTGLRLSDVEPQLLRAGAAVVASNTVLLLVLVTTIAALTKDVKGAVLGVILLFAGVFATFSLLGYFPAIDEVQIGKHIGLALSVLAAFLLLPLYAARERSWALSGASFLALLVLLIVRGVGPSEPKAAATGPVDSTLVTIERIDRAALLDTDKRDIKVKWAQWSKNGGGVLLRDARVVAYLRDGSSRVLAVNGGNSTSSQRDTSAGDSQRLVFKHTLKLDRDDQAARLSKLARDLVRITVEATIVESLPQEVSRVPLGAGPRQAVFGARSQLTLQRPDESGIVLRLRYSGMTADGVPKPRADLSGLSDTSFKLEWSGAARAIGLTGESGTWTSTCVAFSGLQTSGGAWELKAAGDAVQALRADTSWMTNSELVISAQKVVRSTRIVATTIVQ